MRLIPDQPTNMPRMGNRVTRGVGRTLMRIQGWKMTGEFPNEPKLMVALAPHTSNWDFVVAMPVIMALGIKVSFLMKEEAFVWPLNRLFQWWGGIPINRSEGRDMLTQVVDWYDTHEQVWVAITPEGTRKAVSEWKTGFARIAHQANVPIMLIGWDYPNKRMHCDDWLINPSENYKSDVDAIKKHMLANYVGCKPENH